MKFCEQCDNMYYISVNEDDHNKLEHYCRNCKHVDELLASDSMCVLNTNFKNNDNNYHYIINKYTKFDPTLPHIYNIPCPNEQCKTNTSEMNSDVIYLRYDNAKMKYIYICTVCDTNWKTNEKK